MDLGMSTKQIRNLAFVIYIVFAVGLGITILATKTSPELTTQHLINNKGFQVVHTLDRAFLECNQWEWVGLNFKGTDRSGTEVEGIACEGIFSDNISIRM